MESGSKFVVLVVLMCIIEHLVLAATQNLVRLFPFQQSLFHISKLAKGYVKGLIRYHFLTRNLI